MSALVLLTCTWISFYLIGYGVLTALVLAWASTGILIPGLSALKSILPDLPERLHADRNLLQKEPVRQAVRTERR